MIDNYKEQGFTREEYMEVNSFPTYPEQLAALSRLRLRKSIDELAQLIKDIFDAQGWFRKPK